MPAGGISASIRSFHEAAGAQCCSNPHARLRSACHQWEITAKNMVFIVRHHQEFTVTKGGNGFSITAPENKTGCTVSDQINVYWQANQMVAHIAIGVAQFSTKMRQDKDQPCMVAKRSEVDALVTDSTQSAEPSAILPDYDAAIRKRTGDGSNAVRVILSSAASSVTGRSGQLLHASCKHASARRCGACSIRDLQRRASLAHAEACRTLQVKMFALRCRGTRIT